MGNIFAGVKRININPPIGIKRPGIRLFADPIQSIESDLTATALVLKHNGNKIAIIACDLAFIPIEDDKNWREIIGKEIGTNRSHIMINCSHTHSGPAFPSWIEEDPEQMKLQEKYYENLKNNLINVTKLANENLVECRIGADFGNVVIGMYRRETGEDGRDILGEVPEAPIDPSVGVVRVDDTDGNNLVTLFSYGCHPVTMGPRSMLASSDYPGAAREIVENTLGGLSMFLQACGGNINPIYGIGYEVDCRDTKNRTGHILGSEVVKVASNIRTNIKLGKRKPLGNIPNIKFRAWDPVEDTDNNEIRALEKTVGLDFIDLPPLEKAEEIHNEWKNKLTESRKNDAKDWEISVAKRFTNWSSNLLQAIRKNNPPLEVIIQAFKINEIVFASISMESFFETGIEIKNRSPYKHTQVLGYTNGTVGYLPRAKDFPKDGWKITERYAVPDLFFQSYSLPTAIKPESEEKVVDELSNLILQLK